MYIIGQVSAGGFPTIQCTNVNTGRFVAIQLDQPGILTVCELQIFGGKSVFDLIVDCSYFGEKYPKKSSQINNFLLFPHQL